MIYLYHQLTKTFHPCMFMIHSNPTSCSTALILVLNSTLLYSIFIFSFTNCPTYCFKNAISL